MLGLSKGRIIIKMQKFNYTPGDSITGKVTLDLKKPVQARELSITLIAVKKSAMASLGGNNKNDRAERVYNFEMPLDGEKEYTKGMEYDFEIPIPADISNIQPNLGAIGGKLGQGLQLAQSAMNMIGKGSQLKWFLQAKLDVPKGIDIKDKQDIVIQ